MTFTVHTLAQYIYANVEYIFLYTQKKYTRVYIAYLFSESSHSKFRCIVYNVNKAKLLSISKKQKKKKKRRKYIKLVYLS